MPGKSGGQLHQEEWSDNSDLSSPPRSSSPPAPRSSSIGEARDDARPNYIDSVTHDLRNNLARAHANVGQPQPNAPDYATAGGHGANVPPRFVPDAIAGAQQALVNGNNNQPPDNAGLKQEGSGGATTTVQAANGQTKKFKPLPPRFKYPTPHLQVLPATPPNASSATSTDIDSRRAAYGDFGAPQSFVNNLLPAEDPNHFNVYASLHVHFIIKKVGTSQCDECKAKGKGEEIYQCTTCAKQICRTCMDGLIDKENKGLEDAKRRAQLGLAEIDEDEYLWRWQGEFRHKGLKECYVARKRAGVTGDYEIQVPVALLSPAEPGDQVVTVKMELSYEADEEGDDEEDDAVSKKRARSDSPSDTNISSPARSDKQKRKKQRQQNIARSYPADPASQAETLRYTVYGNTEMGKKMQRIQKAAAARGEHLEPVTAPAARDGSVAGRYRPALLDLSAAQPSPDLPQVARQEPLQPPLQPPVGYQYPPPRYPPPALGQRPQLPPGAMVRDTPQQEYDAAQQYQQAPQPNHQGPPPNRDPFGPPQMPQQQPRQRPRASPQARPVPRFGPPPAACQPQLQYDPYANPNWGPRPPMRAPRPSHGNANGPNFGSLAPPPGTMMQFEIGGQKYNMPWEEFQMRAQQQKIQQQAQYYQQCLQRQRQPPTQESTFQPANLVRRGNNPNLVRFPVAEYRPDRVGLIGRREIVPLPFTLPYQVERGGHFLMPMEFDRMRTVDEVMAAANGQWNGYQNVTHGIRRAENNDNLVPVVEQPINRGQAAPAVSAAAPAVPIVADVLTRSPENMTPEVNEPGAVEDAPASPTDSVPSRPRSAPVHDFHPPRRFPTPPSLRKPLAERITFPGAVSSSVPPSSPPVPAAEPQSRSVPPPSTPTGAANELEGTTLTGSESRFSQADTLLLTPTPVRRAATEPDLPPPPPPPTPQAPSTPIGQAAATTAPTTPNTRNSPAPATPAYHAAHTSPRRAEQAIDNGRQDALRRAGLRAILAQLPESQALGLAQDDVPITPARMVAQRGLWKSPPPGAVNDLVSSPVEPVEREVNKRRKTVEESDDDEQESDDDDDKRSKRRKRDAKGKFLRKPSTRANTRAATAAAAAAEESSSVGNSDDESDDDNVAAAEVDNDDDRDGDFNDNGNVERSSPAMRPPVGPYMGSSTRNNGPATRASGGGRVTRARSGSAASRERSASASVEPEMSGPDTPTRRTRSGREFTPYAAVTKPEPK